MLSLPYLTYSLFGFLITLLLIMLIMIINSLLFRYSQKLYWTANVFSGILIEIGLSYYASIIPMLIMKTPFNKDNLILSIDYWFGMVLGFIICFLALAFIGYAARRIIPTKNRPSELISIVIIFHTTAIFWVLGQPMIAGWLSDFSIRVSFLDMLDWKNVVHDPISSPIRVSNFFRKTTDIGVSIGLNSAVARVVNIIIFIGALYQGLEYLIKFTKFLVRRARSTLEYYWQIISKTES